MKTALTPAATNQITVMSAKNRDYGQICSIFVFLYFKKEWTVLICPVLFPRSSVARTGETLG